MIRVFITDDINDIFSFNEYPFAGILHKDFKSEEEAKGFIKVCRALEFEVFVWYMRGDD